jgi:hypothetical protein
MSTELELIDNLGSEEERLEEAADYLQFKGVVVSLSKPKFKFSALILDEKDEIELTPDVIKEKGKALTDLVIKDVDDKEGYENVKKAITKAVKTRTTIEKWEKEQKKKIEGAKSVLTDYCKDMYAECLAVQKNLEDKRKIIDDAIAAEKLRKEEEAKAKTVAREEKMYSLGMVFNGVNFSGYGKMVTKEGLFSFDDEKYKTFISEIEEEKQAEEIANASPNIPIPVASSSVYDGVSGSTNRAPSSGSSATSANTTEAVPQPHLYEVAIPTLGVKIIISTGELKIEPDEDAILSNDRIGQSKYYVNVLR